jgi:2-polyprenyl-3-methyl-5-hydroxy-6-metoxy-1,4-benzoquinol methylase
VSFEVHDISGRAHREPFDLIVMIEALHDLSQPVPALAAIRESLAPDGVAIIADERVADSFTAPGDEAERLFYGASILVCLPAGMADQPSAATGTVMRASTMRSYALEAGFKDVEVLDLDHPMLRFYRLVQ